MKTEELINSLQEENFTVYRTNLRAEIINHGVEFVQFGDFLHFAHDAKVSSIFLHEMFDSIDEYYISEESIERYYDYAEKIVRKEVEKYNNNLWKIDFDSPVMIIIAYLVEGAFFYTVFDNELSLDGEPLVPAKEKLQEIIDKHYDEILIKREETEQEIIRLKTKLKQEVLLDDEFYKCTNKHLRYSYMSNLYRQKLKGDFAKLKKYWESPGLAAFTKDAEDFIELVWREYKAK